MVKLKECKRQNLCVDCNDTSCSHHGQHEADCPKYKCDNPIAHDCEHCEFLKQYTTEMRKNYAKNLIPTKDNHKKAHAVNLKQYNTLLKQLIHSDCKAVIKNDTIYHETTHAFISKPKIITTLNKELNITISSIHPENQDTIWIVYTDNNFVNNITYNIMYEVNKALIQYSSDNIDVVIDEESQQLCVIYHSNNNSFPIAANLGPKNCIDLKQLETFLDELHIGHCW